MLDVFTLETYTAVQLWAHGTDSESLCSLLRTVGPLLSCSRRWSLPVICPGGGEQGNSPSPPQGILPLFSLRDQPHRMPAEPQQEGGFTPWDHEEITSSWAGCTPRLEFQLWRKQNSRTSEELLQSDQIASSVSMDTTTHLSVTFCQELFGHYVEDKPKLHLLLLWQYHQKDRCSSNCVINPTY